MLDNICGFIGFASLTPFDLIVAVVIMQCHCHAEFESDIQTDFFALSATGYSVQRSTRPWYRPNTPFLSSVATEVASVEGRLLYLLYKPRLKLSLLQRKKTHIQKLLIYLDKAKRIPLAIIYNLFHSVVVVS